MLQRQPHSRLPLDQAVVAGVYLGQVHVDGHALVVLRLTQRRDAHNLVALRVAASEEEGDAVQVHLPQQVVAEAVDVALVPPAVEEAVHEPHDLVELRRIAQEQVVQSLHLLSVHARRARVGLSRKLRMDGRVAVVERVAGWRRRRGIQRAHHCCQLDGSFDLLSLRVKHDWRAHQRDDGHVVGLRQTQEEAVRQREERIRCELGNQQVGGSIHGTRHQHAVRVVYCERER